MKRTVAALLALLLLIGGLVIANADEHGKGKTTVKTLAHKDIAETVDGKNAAVTTVELTLEPGHGGAPHRHPGPVFGYVLEGVYEWAIDDQPATVLKVGDTFYEPTGCLHRVSRNPGKTRARVLAVLLHPRDAKQLAAPERK
jgi:quercetin dioxygenase-like cupin family protein